MTLPHPGGQCWIWQGKDLLLSQFLRDVPWTTLRWITIPCWWDPFCVSYQKTLCQPVGQVGRGLFAGHSLWGDAPWYYSGMIKGFEAKLWKGMFQIHCKAEFPACFDVTANVIHPPYVSRNSPDLTVPGLKTIAAPQGIYYTPQSCRAHLRVQSHVLFCAATLWWQEALRTKLSPVFTSEPLGLWNISVGLTGTLNTASM